MSKISKASDIFAMTLFLCRRGSWLLDKLIQFSARHKCFKLFENVNDVKVSHVVMVLVMRRRKCDIKEKCESRNCLISCVKQFLTLPLLSFCSHLQIKSSQNDKWND